MNFDTDYIVRVLEFLGHLEAGGVTEVRIFPKERHLSINGRRQYVGKVVSGYYNDYKKLARDIKPFDGKASIYITINPCKPELLTRSPNRLRFSAKVTTSDDDILCDLWFPIDTDPVRPAGISSTDDELKSALAKRDEVAEFLSRRNGTVRGMSGNGGHGLIRLPGYPNVLRTRQAKQRLLHFLSDRFSDWETDSNGKFILDGRGRKILRQDGVSVDNTVFNMSRIWKLYGTLACKGETTPHRQHRRSYLDIRKVKPVDLYTYIDEIIPMDERLKPNPSPEPSAQKGIVARSEGGAMGYFPLLNVASYLDAWGGEWRSKEKSTVTWYQFRICPLHTDYDGHEWECGVCQSDSGKLGAKCMHEPSYSWQDFKVVLGDPREFYVSGDVQPGFREPTLGDTNIAYAERMAT